MIERQDYRPATRAQARCDGRRPGLCLAVLAVLAILAGCAPSQPGALPPTRVPQVLATDTPTPLATSTPTPIPSPTPTPVAALPAGLLPGGRVFFSTQRLGDTAEELWQVGAVEGLKLAQPTVLPGRWQCAAGDALRCAFVTSQGALQVSEPASGTLALLDDFSALVAPAPTPPGRLLPVSDTLAAGSTAPLSQTLALSGTRAISPSIVPLQLALSPDAAPLAVASYDAVQVFELAPVSLAAQMHVTGTSSMAWSPDSSLLAFAYPAAAGVDTVALWNWREGSVRALAAMRAAGDLAWAPDGAKLAFAARQEPPSPASQGSQSDVFVVFLKSGEVANLTEVFLRNNGLPPEQQVGAWAPAWEADSSHVRYVVGAPDEPGTQSMVRHALRSRKPGTLWQVAESGAAGVAPGPAGQFDARVADRDGRQVVQVRASDGEWLDATSGTFDGLHSLVWAPPDLQAAGADGSVQDRYLLLVAKHALYVLDIVDGQIGGLAVACPTCTVERAVWLP